MEKNRRGKEISGEKRKKKNKKEEEKLSRAKGRERRNKFHAFCCALLAVFNWNTVRNIVSNNVVTTELSFRATGPYRTIL
jgi:hypothetical protein